MVQLNHYTQIGGRLATTLGFVLGSIHRSVPIASSQPQNKEDKCYTIAEPTVLMEKVMKDVYEDWNDPTSWFPVQIPETEAGLD